MTQEEKIALISYLYVNGETQKFLCNDFFQELNNIIPDDICISADNLNDERREENYLYVKLAIYAIFNKFPKYREILSNVFSNFKDEELIEHLLLGYVFYIANIDTNINIFKDKMSICYTEGPALYSIIL